VLALVAALILAGAATWALTRGDGATGDPGPTVTVTGPGATTSEPTGGEDSDSPAEPTPTRPETSAPPTTEAPPTTRPPATPTRPTEAPTTDPPSTPTSDSDSDSTEPPPSAGAMTP
jgi:hypothetical protein